MGCFSYVLSKEMNLYDELSKFPQYELAAFLKKYKLPCQARVTAGYEGRKVCTRKLKEGGGVWSG